MEINDIKQHINELLQGYSNEECTKILKGVISEFQSRIENCDEDFFVNFKINKRNRYFLISYFTIGKVDGVGEISVETNGFYPNNLRVKDLIKSKLEDENVDIVIFNIIELSESDHNDWISKKQN